MGIIGLSGKAEFPHLHLSVGYRGVVVDSFLGAGVKAGCSVMGRPLWQPALLAEHAYRPSGVLASGFAGQVPSLKQIVAGRHRHDLLDRTARNLVFWVMIFGLQPGDEEVLQIITLNWEVLATSKGKPATKHKVHWFAYSSKRARRPWRQAPAANTKVADEWAAKTGRLENNGKGAGGIGVRTLRPSRGSWAV